MNSSAGIHMALARAYKLVAAVFMPPSKSRSVLVEGGAIRDVLNSVGGSASGDFHPVLAEALESVRGLALSLWECAGDEKCWTRFNVSLTGLIITSFKRVKCPPYESLYLAGRGSPRVYELPQVADSLKRYYAMLGLKFRAGSVPAMDHVSVELEYLAALHEIEALLHEATPGSLEVSPGEVSMIRSKFLAEHALRWMPRFADCIDENTDDPIVKRAAHTLKVLLEAENIL